jgi:hypothetical protein
VSRVPLRQREAFRPRPQAGIGDIDHQEAGGMTELERRLDPEDEAGYGAAIDGDRDDAPDQEQPQNREPSSEEEVEQDNYANTDEGRS